MSIRTERSDYPSSKRLTSRLRQQDRLVLQDLIVQAAAETVTGLVAVDLTEIGEDALSNRRSIKLRLKTKCLVSSKIVRSASLR
ncbi:hypothetical protein D3C76_1369910 [compost metagenome]